MIDELRRVAGDDLADLVDASGRRLRGFRPITTIPSAVDPRATFFLDLDGGPPLKGRRLRSEEQLRRAHELGLRLGPGFSRVVARRGGAWLEEWIEGDPFAALGALPAPLLERCGRMLGSVHRIDAAPADASLPGVHLARLDERAPAAGLEPDEIERVRALARAHLPADAGHGLVHLDFCAENLIVAADGAPVCVDNARVDHGALPFDLARTWYRWPMSPEDRSGFLRGYRGATGGDAPAARGFFFWALCALVRATAWRTRVAPPLAEALRRRLRGLLAWSATCDADQLAASTFETLPLGVVRSPASSTITAAQ